jgi:hypothetical protein
MQLATALEDTHHQINEFPLSRECQYATAQNNAATAALMTIVRHRTL